MEFYIVWCIASFIRWCIVIIIDLYNAIFVRTRIQSENYHKVFMFYKFSEWKFVKGEQNFLWNFLLTVFKQLILWTALSRLTIIFNVLWVISLIKIKKKIKETFSKKTMDEAEEIRLKIKYTPLNKSEMEESLRKLDDLFWTKEFTSPDESECDYEDEEYVIHSFDWTNSYMVDGNKLYVHSHPDDWLSNFHTTYEYKIEWTKISVRTIESRTEHAWDEEYYEIKDWVVLESEVIKRIKWDKFALQSEKEKIKELKEQTKRSEFNYTQVKAYILSKNLSDEDFRIYQKAVKNVPEEETLLFTRQRRYCSITGVSERMSGGW